jgi:hypothetical protein
VGIVAFHVRSQGINHFTTQPEFHRYLFKAN